MGCQCSGWAVSAFWGGGEVLAWLGQGGCGSCCERVIEWVGGSWESEQGGLKWGWLCGD